MSQGFESWTVDDVNAHNARVAAAKIGNRSAMSCRSLSDVYENIQRKASASPFRDPVDMSKVAVVTQPPIPKPTSKAWLEIGGKKHYFRSLWEQNYARYLQFLKEQGHIMDWEYEPETFWFDGIRRGANNYKPDFRVTDKTGAIEYREVKGYLDSESKTKLKRMKKYHPTVQLRLIDSVWFKKNSRNLAAIVPGWAKK
jgi:hypothetical protein